MDYKIRPFDEHDLEGCLACVKSNVPEYFAEEDIAEVEKFLKKPPCPDLYVVEQDEKVMGFGGFCFQGRTARLTYGIIHKSFQGQGIGKELLEYRIEKARKQKPGVPITLETTDRTWRFFNKYGFKVEDIVPMGYNHGLFDKYEMKFEA